MVQFHLFHVCFILFIVIVIKEVFRLNLVPLPYFLSWSNLLETIKRVTIIQIILFFLFSLGIKDIYFIWLSLVIILTVKKFIYLPININNVSSFLSCLAIALAIASLGAFCLESVLADYNIKYILKAGNSQHGTSNDSGGNSGGNSDGGGLPPKGNSDLTVYHAQDKTVNKESNSESHLPQSTSLNSITSETSYTESDLATAAKVDKQNFSNVVKTDTTQASNLYNEKVDELAKAKSELLKYKKSGKIEVGIKVVEEDPF